MNMTTRNKLGLMAIIFLTIAAVTYGLHWAYGSEPYGWSLRIGAVMFMLWLAWPELRQLPQQLPKWVFWAAIPVFVLCVFRPIVFLYVGLALLVYLYVIPKKK